MPFQVSLSKERFKFSSTHFTIFNDSEAECLHGHNYLVSVDLGFKSLAEDFHTIGLEGLSVTIEETNGQAVTYIAE